MFVEASLAPLSQAQLKKLQKGMPVRVKYGTGLKVPVLPAQLRKLMKAHMLGKGMVLHAPAPTIMPVGPRPTTGGPRSTTGGVNPRSTTGGVNPRSTTGGNLIKTSKDTGKSLITAGGDRAVQAIEGSGATKFLRSVLVNKTVSPIKKAASARAVKAIEGSGSRDFSFSETAQQLKEGRPFKKKDGSAPMSVNSIKSGNPFGGMMGGSRVDKFGKWTKAIGQFVKPVAKPILEAATTRAVGEINSYNNPEYQIQQGIDMLQRELPQTMGAFSAPKTKAPVYQTPEAAPATQRAPRVPRQPRAPRAPRQPPAPRQIPVVYAEPVEKSYYDSARMFPSVPQELNYEPVVWYGSGLKKGSPEMRAKMAALRAMRGVNPRSTTGGVNPRSTTGGVVKGGMVTKPFPGPTIMPISTIKPKKGSPEMKAKMAGLRSMKRGGAMYPAGMSGSALYPAGYEA